jgi:hypothetical protein
VALLHGSQFAQPFAYPLLRIVAYGTSVYQHIVGLLYFAHHLVTLFLQKGGHNLAVRKIHLAAVCFYINIRHISL